MLLPVRVLKYVHSYRRHCVCKVHRSEELLGYLFKTHMKHTYKSVSFSRPGSHFWNKKCVSKSLFALTVGTAACGRRFPLSTSRCWKLPGSGQASLCLRHFLHKPCDSHVSSFTSHLFCFSSQHPSGCSSPACCRSSLPYLLKGFF